MYVLFDTLPTPPQWYFTFDNKYFLYYILYLRPNALHVVNRTANNIILYYSILFKIHVGKMFGALGLHRLPLIQF